jgi:hypothetical protein
MTGTLHEDRPATTDVYKTRACNIHCCTVHVFSIISLIFQLMHLLYTLLKALFYMNTLKNTQNLPLHVSVHF